MTEEQLSLLIELTKTQNDMIARMGLILVRITWLLVTVVIILFTLWLFFFLVLSGRLG